MAVTALGVASGRRWAPGGGGRGVAAADGASALPAPPTLPPAHALPPAPPLPSLRAAPQVYRARVRATGQEVAVKVQRPAALATISKDLYVMRRAVGVYEKIVRRFTAQVGLAAAPLLCW